MVSEGQDALLAEEEEEPLQQEEEEAELYKQIQAFCCRKSQVVRGHSVLGDDWIWPWLAWLSQSCLHSAAKLLIEFSLLQPTWQACARIAQHRLCLLLQDVTDAMAQFMDMPTKVRRHVARWPPTCRLLPLAALVHSVAACCLSLYVQA
jgi:hypothetical protein